MKKVTLTSAGNQTWLYFGTAMALASVTAFLLVNSPRHNPSPPAAEVVISVPPTPLKWTVMPAPKNVTEGIKCQTVMVRMTVDGKPAGSGSGTLFKATLKTKEEIVVLTAGHLFLTDQSTNIAARIESQYRAADGKLISTTAFDTEILFVDHHRDTALLRVKAPDVWPEYALAGPSAPLPEGTDLMHVGFMLGDAYPLTVVFGRVARCGVQPEAMGWPWEIPLDLADMMVMPGSSGGGVFNSEGFYIGMLVGCGPRGEALFVPLRTIREAVLAAKLDIVFGLTLGIL